MCVCVRVCRRVCVCVLCTCVRARTCVSVLCVCVPAWIVSCNLRMVIPDS